MPAQKHFFYEIQYTRAADKFFNKHEDIREEYEASVKELLTGEHPERVDVKKVRGKRNVYYRIVLVGYRVVYAFINGKIVVINTLLAGARGDVYKKMSGIR